MTKPNYLQRITCRLRVFFFGVTGFYRVSLVHGISRALPIVPLPSVTEFLLHVKLKCHLPL